MNIVTPTFPKETMATTQKTNTPSATQSPKLVTREGLRKFTGDVVGFHDCETQGHIYGVPRAAKLSDSALDASKPSCFVIFELLEPCDATEGSGTEFTNVQAKTGEMVGVWMKGGMRAIKQLCGVPVLMQFTGEKKLKGKPAAFNAMKTFQFDVGKGIGTLIPVIEDNRKDSRNVPTFLDAKKPEAKPGREPGDDSDDFGF